MGRPGPVLLGIEIGGTKLQLAVGGPDGRIAALKRLTITPASGAEGILRQIETAYEPLLKEAQVGRADVAAAGVGFGGPVDADAGRVTLSHTVAGWENFPMADWVTRTLEIPVVAVENDADAAGLAEARLGAGVGRSPILYLTIGSGIGGGLIVDGSVYRGAGAGAVEIGHLWVTAPESQGRSRRELEDVASGFAIAASARALALNEPDWDVSRRVGGDAGRISTELVAGAAAGGDPLALRLIDQATTALAEALRQAVTLLAPRRIILGGGVSLLGETLWFGPIRAKLDADVFLPFRSTYDLVPAVLGESVVVHGALVMAGDRLGAEGSMRPA